MCLKEMIMVSLIHCKIPTMYDIVEGVDIDIDIDIVEGVDGILMWRLDIMDETSGEPNKAGLENIRLTQ